MEMEENSEKQYDTTWKKLILSILNLTFHATIDGYVTK